MSNPAPESYPKRRHKPLRFSPTLTEAGIEPILLRIPEAAQCLGISDRMLYDMINAHELPLGSVVFVRGKTRIVYAALKKWYEGQAV